MVLGEDKNRSELIELLKQKRALLMVGAGSSAFVGYPTWPQLVNELRETFAPRSAIPEDLDAPSKALQIRQQAQETGRLEEYFRHLTNRFRPRATGRDYNDFHTELVRLGFCGIATLNYDVVLETAIIAASHDAGYHSGCEAIDLRAEKRQQCVHKYLQSLRPAECHGHVLHLHGIYNNAERIILTRQDYQDAYDGLMSGSRVAVGDTLGEMSGELAAHYANAQHPQITFQKKVMWALLATHPMLFVGFGMNDGFFLDVIRMVREDFNLCSEQVHYALMSYRERSHTEESQREKTERDLKALGISPIFYYVPEPEGLNGDEDHSGLKRLVSELARSVGVSTVTPRVPAISPNDISRRMLEL